MKKTTANNEENARIYAIVSIVLSSLAVIGSIPAGLCVLPIMIISIILAIMGLKSETARILSIISLVINGIGLLFGFLMTICAASAILPYILFSRA